MKKVLRVSLIVVGVFFVLLIAAALILPPILKPKIEAAINKAVAENVHAQVNGIKAENLSVSLFTNFPNITAAIKDISVVNFAPFEGDTLAAISSFEVEVNLYSLFGSQYQINGISLNNPNINIKVLEDGKTNYDIAKSTGKTTEEEKVEEPTTETAPFGINIDHWSVNGANIVYDDATMPFLLKLENLNHKGSGNTNLSEYDLNTNTSVGSMVVSYGGITYLSGQSLELDLITNIAMDAQKIAIVIKENAIKLSNMGISAQGNFGYQFESGDMEMDIRFAATESGFKDLLSLIPATYLQGFESLKADGQFSFEGQVVGAMTATEMPGFQVSLNVKEGMFQYPDLPSSVDNINVDMSVAALDGNYDNLTVDIKNFHLNLGKAPINGRLMVKGPLASMTNIETSANISANMKLEDFADIFPMEGYEIKGDFAFNCVADGTYDTLGQIPKIDLLLQMSEGYVVTPDVPYPIEQINFKTIVKNETGKMDDLAIKVDQASFVMNQEPFEANGKVNGLSNAAWDFNVKGAIDLGIVSNYYVDPAMTLKGKIKADIHTEGTLDKIYAEKYDQLPTRGVAEIMDFAYGSTDYFPTEIKTVDISYAKADFTPEAIFIKECKGKTGKSDFRATGTISNYMGYTFNGTTLKGRMDINSNYFDIDQWMSYESEEEDAGNTGASAGNTSHQAVTGGGNAGSNMASVSQGNSSSAMEDMAIPKNIDFAAAAKITKAMYSGVPMDNVNGTVEVKNGIASVKVLRFNSLGGSFVMNGAYNTADPSKPKFDADMRIQQLSFKSAYENFNSVQAMAPAAQNITGDFGTNMKISGLIGADYFPVYETLNGDMLLNISEAAIKDNDVLKKLADQLKNPKFANPTLDDVRANMKIQDGNVHIAPTNFKLSGYPSTIDGKIDVNQNMNLNLKLKIPAADLGQQGQTYQNLTGEKFMHLEIPITGNVTNPKIDAAAAIANVVKKAAGSGLDKLKQQFGFGDGDVKDEAKEKLKEEAENLKGKDQEEIKKEAEKKAEDLKKKGEDAIKDIFKRK